MQNATAAQKTRSLTLARSMLASARMDKLGGKAKGQIDKPHRDPRQLKQGWGKSGLCQSPKVNLGLAEKRECDHGLRGDTGNDQTKEASLGKAGGGFEKETIVGGTQSGQAFKNRGGRVGVVPIQ